MNSDMATKSSSPGWKLGERSTEFQLHKSQIAGSNSVKKILDYSEYKLRIFLENTIDPQQQKTIRNVISSYCKGEIAVAWKSGHPVWIRITKE